MRVLILLVVLCSSIFWSDAKAQVNVGGQTCYQVWGLYDYFSNGVLTASTWEADGLNCYDFGGGGGGGGMFEDSSGPIGEGEVTVDNCTWLQANTPAGCDPADPPRVTLDGCTVVPDYLVVNGTPATSLGAVFTSPCNKHDRCYQTLGSNKQECDTQLEHDMIQAAQESIPSSQWAYYESHVRLQAAAYAYGLYNNIPLVTTLIFNYRQSQAACRAHVAALKANNCPV